MTFNNFFKSCKGQRKLRVGEPRKVTGKDLIGAGLKPDSLFGKKLEAAFRAQIKHPEFDKQKLLEVALSVK